MPAGRPSKLTPERSRRCFEALAAGASRRLAAQHAGIDLTTFERWMKRRGEEYANFAEGVVRAEEEAELSLVATAQRCALGGAVLTRETVTRPDGTRIVHETFAPPDGRLAVEILARRFPREWGRLDRIELSIKERAQSLADELGMSVESVLAEAQRIALNTAADRRGLVSGR
jgi:hypothetical protein